MGYQIHLLIKQSKNICKKQKFKNFGGKFEFFVGVGQKSKFLTINYRKIGPRDGQELLNWPELALILLMGCSGIV